MAESVVFTTKNGNKNVSKQFNFVNPQAADSDVAAAFVALGSLSNNPIVDIQRVSKTSLDFAPPVAAKQTPTVSLSLSEESSGNLYIPFDKGGEASGTITVVTNSNGAISASCDNVVISTSVSGNVITVSTTADGSSGTVSISIAETDSYEAASASVGVQVAYID